MPTLLCVPILVQEAEPALADAAAAKRAGADLVEFRIDQVFDGEGDDAGERLALRLCRESPLPCIVTCRLAAEGGSYDGDEAARLSVYERLGTSDHPPRYLDVELAAYTRSANARMKTDLAAGHPTPRRDLHASLILSTHDFSGRPSDLERRVLAMRGEPAARVHKIAYTARSLRDNLELFDLMALRDRPTIALAMGEFGLMSRVLAPKFGGFLTFASLRPAAATAPGQPTLDELLNLYRFRSIGEGTRVYGVVGWPVGHSLSPLVHNDAFSQAGIDAVYLPLPIVGDGGEAGYVSLKATLGELVDHPRLDFGGCSVTIPHKEGLLRLARERGWEIDPAAAAIGAANTLVVNASPAPPGRKSSVPEGREAAGGACRVLNTDAPAARAWIEEAIGALGGKRIAILGAGGAAMAVAFACASGGARVLIVNRTRARADALVERLHTAVGSARAEVGAADAVAAWRPDAVVNCTPVGMKGGPGGVGDGPMPLPSLASLATPSPPGGEGGIGNRAPVVLDTIYNPLRTPLLAAAERAGLVTRDGVGMFTRQAALQFAAWTGRTPDASRAERLVRRHLGG